MIKNKVVTFIFLFLYSASVFSQNTNDNISNPHKFFAGIGINNHVIGDSFYKGFIIKMYDELNSDRVYDILISKPMVNLSFGYKSSASIFHYINLALGNNTTEFEDSKEMSLRYYTVSYEFNYQFLMNSPSPLKPFAGLSLGYDMKNYWYFRSNTQSPFDQEKYNDLSSLYLMQITDGVTLQNHRMKFSLYSAFDIAGLIKGSYTYNYKCFLCGQQPVIEAPEVTGEYSSGIYNENIHKNIFMFGFHMLYSWH